MGLECGVARGLPDRQFVEDRVFNPFYLARSAWRAIVKNNVTKTVLRFRKRNVEYDHSSGIDSRAPYYFPGAFRVDPAAASHWLHRNFSFRVSEFDAICEPGIASFFPF